MVVATKPESLVIDALKQGRVTLKLIGRTPLYFNSMSVKAKRSLLLGGGKKSTAEKRELKHDPEQEFRNSVYTTQTGETLLGFPAPGVKAAMAEAALAEAALAEAAMAEAVMVRDANLNGGATASRFSA